jgi:hypothetical protein
MIEVWLITWFCITPENADCMSRHERVHGISSGPFYYYSESGCVDSARFLASLEFHERKYRLEYRCDRGTPIQKYDPTRRVP